MEKPGFKTTEFWITVAVLAMAVLVSSGALPADFNEVLGLLAAAIGGGAYSVGRSGVKKAEAAARQ